MNQKGFANIILVVVIVVLIGAVGYFAFVKKSERVAQQPTPTPTKKENPKTVLPASSAPTLTFNQGVKPFVQINFDYSIAKLFNIYRSISATDGWQKIISNFPSGAHTAVDYDYPKDAKVLYYRIVSVDERGKESAPSPIASVAVTAQSETVNWKTYKLDFLEIKYPLGFFAGGFPNEGLGTSLEIMNFQWNKDAYSFPYIKYPPQDKFYMEINSIDNSDNLSIKDWLNKHKDDYGGPEKVQIINEYKQMGGTLVSEKSITIDSKPALQRIIGYQGNTGNVDIVFSYVNYKNQVYQFVGHSTTDNNLKVYNQILSTFKFIK